jgi:threonine/homoserine/homoserine lactone efflux protein
MCPVLPDGPLLAAFLVASVVLAVTPGPGVFYVVTRTLAQGRQAGLASVGGVAAGNLGNAIGASIGLATVFAISSLAFTAVKYAGAAYLVYLGIRALRAPGPGAPPLASGPVRPARIARDGFAVALLNPKTAIFFAAFLPQFMDPAGSPMLQSAALGAAFVAIAAVTDTMYALAASAVAPVLGRVRGAGVASRYATAGAFIGLGLLTATSGSRHSR